MWVTNACEVEQGGEATSFPRISADSRGFGWVLWVLGWVRISLPKHIVRGQKFANYSHRIAVLAVDGVVHTAHIVV